MIRAIIIDDERLARNELKKLLLDFPEIEVIAEAANAAEGIERIDSLNPDLIFLDIQMPELNGLQFMQAIDQRCKVIITSAYTEYAVAGFENNVTDYLLKPISFERFCKAIQKAGSQLAAPEPPPVASHIFVKTDNKLVKVDFEEILYLEGARDYVFIHTVKDKLVTLDSLRNFEDILPSSRFVRIHKSFIAGIDKIDAVEKSRVVIGENFLPIGESHKQAFLAAINKSRGS